MATENCTHYIVGFRIMKKILKKIFEYILINKVTVQNGFFVCNTMQVFCAPWKLLRLGRLRGQNEVAIILDLCIKYNQGIHGST